MLHGAPIATFDLDLVHSRTENNIDRLMQALLSMNAGYREPALGEMRPGKAHLESSGHQLLMTDFGPLDLQGTIGKGRDYNALLPDTITLKLGMDEIRLLALPALISIKEQTAGEKDMAALVILRRVLKEKSKSS